GELKKRFDILVYDREMKPWMLVECKGLEVELNQSVLDQALRYNMSVPVDYILITNGKQTFGWCKGEAGLIEIEKVPSR
ncbi:MAG TPA: type I restriction enzyme HsdR N-terminal domain-containing protein, partial [Chitinophagaceae bacterium]|nr:type I restriction enzyme HsdR N-terminal domain-containing protein [Chitinophagaceae bacterium]